MSSLECRVDDEKKLRSRRSAVDRVINTDNTASVEVNCAVRRLIVIPSHHVDTEDTVISVLLPL